MRVISIVPTARTDGKEKLTTEEDEAGSLVGGTRGSSWDWVRQPGRKSGRPGMPSSGLFRPHCPFGVQKRCHWVQEQSIPVTNDDVGKHSIHLRKITVVKETPIKVALVGVDAANLYESYRKKALPTYVL